MNTLPLFKPCRTGGVAVGLAAFLTALSALADGIIRNDTVWHDAAGREIWSNGGHIIQEGEVFYWVGYDTGPGRWPWRVNLYSSRNLGDWKFENTVIRMEGKFANVGWAGRPALLHCRTTGLYVSFSKPIAHGNGNDTRLASRFPTALMEPMN